MTILQIIDAFAFYGVDTLLLSALTALTVQLFKKTLLKKANKKIYTFLPFIFGAVYYALYAVLMNMDFMYLVENYVDALEKGFSVGAVSTLMYVWYEQFLRTEKTTSAAESVISTLIEGYVPSDGVEAVAKEIAETIERDVTGDGAKKTAEILLKNGENVTEENVKLLSKLIIETLAHINSAV